MMRWSWPLWLALNTLCVQQRVALELPGLHGVCHRMPSAMCIDPLHCPGDLMSGCVSYDDMLRRV